MKTLVVVVLLLCLSVPGHCDCQRDCLSCRTLMDKELHFNSMVCLIECEGIMSPSPVWEGCRQALALSQFSSMVKKAREEVGEGVPPARGEGEEEGGAEEEEEEEEERTRRMERRRAEGSLLSSSSAAAAAAALTMAMEPSDAYDGLQNSLSLGRVEEEGEEERAEAAGISVSKRFGGFLKGRHGYRKLVAPGRSYQKRYGGFIGVRKSARKWNNQKRFSEFLKQYLGMGARGGQFHGLTSDLIQQNEV